MVDGVPAAGAGAPAPNRPLIHDQQVGKGTRRLHARSQYVISDFWEDSRTRSLVFPAMRNNSSECYVLLVKDILENVEYLFLRATNQNVQIARR